MKKKKKNHLLEKVVSIISEKPKGTLLDVGSGEGAMSKLLFDKGLKVTAFDMDKERFNYKNEITFKEGNLDNRLPFDDNSFDYILFLEVIEHIYNPDYVISEISRVLKPDGTLLLSTPNILNVSSRLRFLFEGSFDFFREPILDYAKIFPVEIQNMHVILWRYHELEYLLKKNKLQISCVHTDIMKTNLKILAHFLRPFLRLQGTIKIRRSRKKKGIDFQRIHTVMLSKELLTGRHLIVEAVKS